MEQRYVYLDYNATTPVRDEVQKVIIEAMRIYGNASSMHRSGREARALLEEARQAVASLIGAGRAEDVIFTSGGSESNNTVFETARNIIMRKAGGSGGSPPRNEIITTAVEHPCVLNSAKYLQELGYPVTFLRVDATGKIKMDEYRAALSEKTLLVSVMMANNEIGTIQDIAEIARLAKDAGALVHTDAVQAVGKIPVDVEALRVDYLTMSCHKIYGPKGIGALYKRRSAPLSPLIHGGHQEDGFRAGTYNNWGIIGFGEAARLAKQDLASYGSMTRALRDTLRDGLLKAVPRIKVNGHPVDVLPNTLNVSFPGAEGEAILLSLDLEGIEASTGSACASGSLDPSHVLMAIGVWPELAHGSIRFSLGRETTPDDIAYVLEKTPPIIHRLRSMSTVQAPLCKDGTCNLCD
jgi:cysteine desulfurase